jgi:hypothetical protein
MTISKLLLVAVLSGSLFGQSAKEKALQAQLDAAQAALAASTRAGDQLAQELAKANAAAVAKAATALRMPPLPRSSPPLTERRRARRPRMRLCWRKVPPLRLARRTWR